MFLTLKNEKTLKKMRSKTLKNNIFFILGRNLIIRSFEIPHSIWKLHKDFKSVFVFKFRQKTKKFTPKWQKPLFEKRVNPKGQLSETRAGLSYNHQAQTKSGGSWIMNSLPKVVAQQHEDRKWSSSCWRWSPHQC